MTMKHTDISVQGYERHAKGRNTNIGIEKEWKKLACAISVKEQNLDFNFSFFLDYSNFNAT